MSWQADKSFYISPWWHITIITFVLRRPTSSFIVWHMSTLISFTWHPYGFHMIRIYQVVYNASLYKWHAGSNWERSQWMYTYVVKKVRNGSRCVSIGGTGLVVYKNIFSTLCDFTLYSFESKSLYDSFHTTVVARWASVKNSWTRNRFIFSQWFDPPT